MVAGFFGAKQNWDRMMQAAKHKTFSNQAYTADVDLLIFGQNEMHQNLDAYKN